jgi:transposase
MVEGMRWVGLDVHSRSSTAAVLDAATGEVRTHRLEGWPHEVLGFLETIEGPFRAVYEAGPSGYGLARRGRALGMSIDVCAPGHLVRSSRRERVKTDKRDAIRLARCLAAGELVLVSILSEEHEQLRDLVRCRDDIRCDLMRARHRLAKFLMRRECYYEGKFKRWSAPHLRWLAEVSFPDHASQLTLTDYLHAHDVLLARRATIDQELTQLAEDSPWTQTIARLRCLRGVDTLTALGLCSEIGGFERFPHPDQLSAYLGLVPSEHSSGERRRQGSITRAGSSHARRLLIEGSYHYLKRPRIGEKLARRQQGQPAAVIDTAWRAQRRLHARWQALKERRGKRGVVVATAVARELAGFCWEIALVD